MNQTIQKTQSLLDIWNSDTGVEDTDGSIQFPERIKLQEQLEHILNLPSGPNDTYRDYEYRPSTILLKEYRRYFEWDSLYSLTFHWEMYGAHTTIKNVSNSVLNEYTTRSKRPEKPDFSSFEEHIIDYEKDFTGKYAISSITHVSNLCLKSCWKRA